MLSELQDDKKTAQAFATSWNNLPKGSVYTKDQFEDWMEPLGKLDFEGKTILELGCGNGSLMVHALAWNPRFMQGVDLGDSIVSAKKNLKNFPVEKWNVAQEDLVDYHSEGFDVVFCIGVLHHLQHPQKGLDALIRNTKSKGKFHAWVYAQEGNGVIVWFVDPLRKITSRLPWWFTKYFVATPLVVPYYVYAKLLAFLPRWKVFQFFSLYEYSLWISRAPFSFFRHVAFDQLVTPQTMYISHQMIVDWLGSYGNIDPASVYIQMRNGNSWKFGGKIK